MDYKAQFQKEAEVHETNIRNLASRIDGLKKQESEKIVIVNNLDKDIEKRSKILSDIDNQIKEHFTLERSRLERWEEGLAKESENLAKNESDLKTKIDAHKTNVSEFNISVSVYNENRENIKKSLLSLKDEFIKMVDNTVKGI
jgi:chromosome segregation ATPase